MRCTYSVHMSIFLGWSTFFGGVSGVCHVRIFYEFLDLRAILFCSCTCHMRSSCTHEFDSFHKHVAGNVVVISQKLHIKGKYFLRA